MSWCLTLANTEKFKKGLKDGAIDPAKLVAMTSAERNAFFAKIVGEENAQQVNALFESKLLLKNQKAGYITWAKKIGGISTKVRMDLISRIERMDKVLNPAEENQFLQDLASARLKVDVTQDEAKTIAELSKKSQELRTKIPENSPIRSKDRLEYGTTIALLKEYVAKLKDEAKQISFREQPIRKIFDVALNVIPNLSQAIMTSYDNSLWLRQMNATLTTPRYSLIFTKNFLKSWRDIGREIMAKGKWYTSGDDAAMLAIKADVYSRPNALNGKYAADTNEYGLGVRSEEVYQNEWPAKIPVLGRLWKASQTAFNGGALRMRSDIADLEIKAAETDGQNVMDKDVASAIGSMVTSITGRGSIGGSESLLRKVFWAPRMYVAQFNRITAHLLDPKANAYTRKRAAKNLVSRLGVLVTIFTLAKLADKDSVDAKENLGKIKIWGKWVEMTGGDSSFVNLAMRMTDKVIAGLGGKKFGFKESTAWDDLIRFAEGKLSPTAGVIRDVLSSELYGGEPITLGGLLVSRFTPIGTQTYERLSKDPTASNLFGLLFLEGIGANVSSWLPSNEKSKIIPTDKVIKNEDFMTMVQVYANALGTDPETAFNRIFTGQKIRRVTNGTIIVERMPVTESEKIKAKAGGKNPQMKLDHTVPLELGGSNSADNLKLVTTSEWSSYTKVENALGTALKAGKISKKDAQAEIIKFKNISDSGDRKEYGEELISKYK